MKWPDRVKGLMNERFYNRFFYYYLHLKRGRIPKRLDLQEPVTFNEKMIWLKMNHRCPDAHILADKVLVKDFVKRAIGGEYLIPTIAVYEDPEQIDFEILPRSFVLKPNHGSGWIIICRDKARLNIRKTRARLKGWLRTDYYRIGKEYQYRDIVPKVLCEAYLENTPAHPLLDYKIFCFSGRPELIQVDLDRFTRHSRNFYSPDWTLLPFTTLYPIGTKALPKPENLAKMLAVARELSKGLVFARIDLYIDKARVLFGEITLHHGGGFEPFVPAEYDLLLGRSLTLPAARGPAS